MKLQPLDIRRKQFEKGFRGYEPADVDAFLKQVADQQGALLDELGQAQDRIRSLEDKLKHYERVEMALQEAMETARETGKRAEAAAEQQARVVVMAAEERALEILRDAERERYAMRQDLVKLSSRQTEVAARLRGFLLSELEVLAQFQGDDPVGFIKLQPAGPSAGGGMLPPTASALAPASPLEFPPHTSDPTAADDADRYADTLLADDAEADDAEATGDWVDDLGTSDAAPPDATPEASLSEGASHDAPAARPFEPSAAAPDPAVDALPDPAADAFPGTAADEPVRSWEADLEDVMAAEPTTLGEADDAAPDIAAPDEPLVEEPTPDEASFAPQAPAAPEPPDEPAPPPGEAPGEASPEASGDEASRWSPPMPAPPPFMPPAYEAPPPPSAPVTHFPPVPAPGAEGAPPAPGGWNLRSLVTGPEQGAPPSDDSVAASEAERERIRRILDELD